ncbi:MAG: tetratricopeptide repeat protein [Fibrella sp.]|nr:tetratricopeptide repeat protein [Armatimonadota bacterium]
MEAKPSLYAPRWATVAGAGIGVILLASPGFATPPKPLIVLFTPGIPAGGRIAKDNPDENILRAKKAVTAVRDRFNETGFVDAVVYAPDSALFVRASQEARLKIGDPASPTATECYALAKAAGAGYSAFVVSGLPSQDSAGGVDIELQTQQVEGRKTWRARRAAGGSGGNSGQSDNALVSAANTLVEDFLRGPLHDLAQAAAPSLPPPQPIPTVRSTPSAEPSATPGSEPNLAVPVPLTAPAPAVAPVTPRTPLPSSGADTDNAAEAERHQGDEQIRAGDVSGAILSYRKAVNLSPVNPTYRTVLASAYLQAGRKGDALSEAKRALDVIPVEDQKGRLAATRLLADILVQNGDVTAARTTYENILRAKPTATWAKVGLAETLLTDGKVDEATALYRSARADAPADKEVLLGYARLLAIKGDYEEALKQLTAATGSGDVEARYRTALQLFDEGITKIADRVEQNRIAWGKKQIAQPVFYKSTASQTAKVSGLVSLLKAVPPPANSDDSAKRKHQKRIFAASLLLQGVASLLTQVETGDANAGGEATVFLMEFGREMREINTASKAVSN